MARTPNEIRKLIQLNQDRGGIQKIRRKPKFDPQIDKRNSNKNKFKESFTSEGV